jgi:hypothetical protein
MVERNALVPLSLDRLGGRRSLHIAMANPLDREALQEVEAVTGCRVVIQLAGLSEITRAIERSYRGMVTKQIRPASAVPVPLPADESDPLRNLADVGPRTQPRHRIEDDASPELKLRALLRALYAKQVLTEAEYLAHLKDLLEGGE